MSSVSRDIFKSIHEQKWLSVEYRNKQDQITRYWIGINELNPERLRPLLLSKAQQKRAAAEQQLSLDFQD